MVKVKANREAKEDKKRRTVKREPSADWQRRMQWMTEEVQKSIEAGRKEKESTNDKRTRRNSEE